MRVRKLRSSRVGAQELGSQRELESLGDRMRRGQVLGDRTCGGWVLGAQEVHGSRRHEESETRGPQMRSFLIAITFDFLTSLLHDNIEIRDMSGGNSL